MATENHETCPDCGNKGRKVDPVTPKSLLVDTARGRIGEGILRFCRTESCPIVYFDERHRVTFGADDLTVPVFQKSEDPERLVCYCFDHSVRSLQEEVRETGSSAVPENIGQKCKEGLDACETHNPQGSCCLGNVRQVVKAAVAAEGREVPTELTAPENCCAGKPSNVPGKHCEPPVRTEATHDCCASETKSAPESRRNPRRRP